MLSGCRCSAVASRMSHGPQRKFWMPVHRTTGTARVSSFAGFRETLALNEPGWDLFLLYGTETRWDGDRPPAPEFWMHQLGIATESTREGPVPRRRLVPGQNPRPPQPPYRGSAETLGHSRHREPLPGGATAHHRAADAPPPTLRRGSVSRALSQRRPEPFRSRARVRVACRGTSRRPSMRSFGNEPFRTILVVGIDHGGVLRNAGVSAGRRRAQPVLARCRSARSTRTS